MGVEDVFRFIAEQFHKKYEEIAHTMGHWEDALVFQ
jgi:hypothetical protein